MFRSIDKDALKVKFNNSQEKNKIRKVYCNVLKTLKENDLDTGYLEGFTDDFYIKNLDQCKNL